MSDLSIECWTPEEAAPAGGWWAVLDCCNDDAGPYPPIALFQSRADADAFITARDGEGDLLAFDAVVTPSLILLDGRIVVGNDYDIETHDQLRSAFARRKEPDVAADLTFPESARRVVAEVIAERERQHAKWGEQDHPDGTGPGALADLSYRCTTAGAAKGQCDRAFAVGTGTYAHIMYEEVCEAFEERDLIRLRTELIQVAAVAVAWAEKLDRDIAEKETPDGR